MQTENFERVARILFFATLNESFAFKKAAEFNQIPRVKLLKELHRDLLNHLKKKKKKNYTIEGHLTLSEKVDLTFWKEYVREANPDHLLPMIYKWIGGFSDEEIEEVLMVTEGSLFTRYNRALLGLGSYLMRGVR